MRTRLTLIGLDVFVIGLTVASPVFGLANRVFVSARSGNDTNSCDNILTPCKTLAGAVTEVAPNGEVIVLDSGGYGPVTITKAMTIEAPPGVTAFIHQPSGDAITINAGVLDRVVLRGLIVNGVDNLTANGISAVSFYRLVVESCQISEFGTGDGIKITGSGDVSLANTSIRNCNVGVDIVSSSGMVSTSIDHCHFDFNNGGFVARTTSPGSSNTTATSSTADGNDVGWSCGDLSSGKDVLGLEFCTGSENQTIGLETGSNNALSSATYSNCVFANNASYGVTQGDDSTVTTVASRGNNTITGNGIAPTRGTIGSFPPM